MQCDMTVHLQGPNANGWHKWKCARPGCTKKTKWTPDTAENIHFQCVGVPRWWEWGEWVGVALALVGLDPARWAKISEHFGFVEPAEICQGCERRKRWLNTIGGRVTMRWRAFVAWLYRPKKASA